MAIRKAMVHPEHLDALERGEMKHGSSGDSDEGEPDDEISDSDEVEDGDDVEDAEEEIEIEQEQEADSFIINTPESMEDPEAEEVSVDFDMEVPDFYDDINVDSKEGFTLEFVQKADLLASGTTTTTLEDEDESIYITTPTSRLATPVQTVISAPHQITYHHHQQQNVQPMAKRARLDVNYAITPASNGTTTTTTTATTPAAVSSPTTFSHQISLGGGQQYAFTVNGQQQQFQQIHPQQQQHHNRRKTPLVTRIA